MINNTSKIFGHGLFMSERTENLIVGFLDRSMKQGPNEHRKCGNNPTTIFILKRIWKDLMNGEH